MEKIAKNSAVNNGGEDVGSNNNNNNVSSYSNHAIPVTNHNNIESSGILPKSTCNRSNMIKSNSFKDDRPKLCDTENVVPNDVDKVTQVDKNGEI